MHSDLVSSKKSSNFAADFALKTAKMIFEKMSIHNKIVVQEYLRSLN